MMTEHLTKALDAIRKFRGNPKFVEHGILNRVVCSCGCESRHHVTGVTFTTFFTLVVKRVITVMKLIM